MILISIISFYNRIIGRFDLKSDVEEYYKHCRCVWDASVISDEFKRTYRVTDSGIIIPSVKIRPTPKMCKYFKKHGHLPPRYSDTEITLMRKYVVHLCNTETEE